jgi:hypothetical protein
LPLLGHPFFALAVLVLLAGFFVLASGGMHRTRRAIDGPNYAAPHRVAAAIEQEPMLGKQQGVRPDWIGQWRDSGKTTERMAYFNIKSRWPKRNRLSPWTGRHALVSPNFFQALGVQAAQGKVFAAETIGDCRNCAVVTNAFAARHLGPKPIGRTLDVENRTLRVIGVLPQGFWFLNEELEVFSPEPQPLLRRAVALAVLRQGATPAEAKAELQSIIGKAHRIDVYTLADKLQSPVRRYTGAALTVFAGIMGVIIWSLVRRKRGTVRYWSFFAAKCTLGLLAVLVFTLEYAGPGSLSATGGSRFEYEALTLWVFVVGNSMFLWWAVSDQRRRCRTCARMLVMPVRIGAPDRVLFEHEATETICPTGHGTLFVEPGTVTFRQPGKWSEFDESWRDLFAPSHDDR